MGIYLSCICARGNTITEIALTRYQHSSALLVIIEVSNANPIFGRQVNAVTAIFTLMPALNPALNRYSPMPLVLKSSRTNGISARCGSTILGFALETFIPFISVLILLFDSVDGTFYHLVPLQHITDYVVLFYHLFRFENFMDVTMCRFGKNPRSAEAFSPLRDIHVVQNAKQSNLNFYIYVIILRRSLSRSVLKATARTVSSELRADHRHCVVNRPVHQFERANCSVITRSQNSPSRNPVESPRGAHITITQDRQRRPL